jgi:hypothetical protein
MRDDRRRCLLSLGFSITSVSAKLSAARVTSGGAVTLTVSAARTVTAAQIVVRADGTTGTATQSHAAAMLVRAP